MNRQFPAIRVLVVSLLVSYFLIGSLLTGEVLLPTGILVLVLVLWFSVYKLRYKGLETRRLVTKMRDDLEGALEGIKERIALEEARKRVAEERAQQVYREREERRGSRPTRDPTVDKYAGLIETRVREGSRTNRDPEGP